MKDLPFMPFFTQSWFGDEKVRTYTYEQQGVYFTILCHLWESGTATLLDNDQDMAKLLGISSRKWKSLRSVLIDGRFAALKSDGLSISQSRLTTEWQKAKKKHGDKTAAGSKGGQQTASNRRADTEQNDSNAVASGQQNDSNSPPYNMVHGTGNMEPSEVPTGTSLAPEVGSPPIGGSPTSLAPGDEEVTNQGIIRDLTRKYREIAPTAGHLKSDWSIIGVLYCEAGSEAVLAGIRALAYAQSNRVIENPIAYVAAVARKWDPESSGNGARGRPSVADHNRAVIQRLAHGEEGWG